jgi:hypothetical protein
MTSAVLSAHRKICDAMPSMVYGCLGCSAECSQCAHTIKTIVNQALVYERSMTQRTIRRVWLVNSGARKAVQAI